MCDQNLKLDLDMKGCHNGVVSISKSIRHLFTMQSLRSLNTRSFDLVRHRQVKNLHSQRVGRHIVQLPQRRNLAAAAASGGDAYEVCKPHH